jgi:hypothetical protein
MRGGVVPGVIGSSGKIGVIGKMGVMGNVGVTGVTVVPGKIGVTKMGVTEEPDGEELRIGTTVEEIPGPSGG